MSIKKKTGLWLWAGFLAALLAAAVALSGLRMEGLSWNKWNPVISILLFAGVACEGLLWLIRRDEITLLPTLCYCAAMAFTLSGTVLVVFDAIRQINWVGGNVNACAFYLAGNLTACIICVIRCFVGLRQKEG